MSSFMRKAAAREERQYEIEKLRLDYAWKWFAFHADQRTKMFNYFILAIGILATALFNWYSKPAIAFVLCVAGSLISLIFSRLDRRNRDLVWLGEEVLFDIERRCLFGAAAEFEIRNGKRKPFGILLRQAREEVRRGPVRDWLRAAGVGKHRVWLQGIAYLAALIFLCVGIQIAIVSKIFRSPAEPPHPAVNAPANPRPPSNNASPSQKP